jgi:hypothetical protein
MLDSKALPIVQAVNRLNPEDRGHLDQIDGI